MKEVVYEGRVRHKSLSYYVYLVPKEAQKNWVILQFYSELIDL